MLAIGFFLEVLMNLEDDALACSEFPCRFLAERRIHRNPSCLSLSFRATSRKGFLFCSWVILVRAQNSVVVFEVFIV